jgi:hypothetical protein
VGIRLHNAKPTEWQLDTLSQQREIQMQDLTTKQLQDLFMHLIETPTPECIKAAKMVLALINDRLLQPADKVSV